MSQCVGITTRRVRCKNRARPGSDCCRLHQIQCDQRSLAQPPAPPVRTSPRSPVQDCVICFANGVSGRDLLKCGHPVCQTCLASLRDPRCPVCRQPLEGPSVTDELITAMLQRQEEDRALEETRNLIVALMLQDNPDLDPQRVYDLTQRNVLGGTLL